MNSFRLQKWAALASDPWHKKSFAKLKQADIAFAREWLEQHASLEKEAFEIAVNRMFLDRPELRARHPRWATISEMLASTNIG